MPALIGRRVEIYNFHCSSLPTTGPVRPIGLAATAAASDRLPRYLARFGVIESDRARNHVSWGERPAPLSTQSDVGSQIPSSRMENLR